MPADGMQWWHVIISTKNSWLPGDKRGFRSRNHKVHSSGDYKTPPPIEEHAALRAYYEKRAEPTVVIPADQLETVGRAIFAKLRKKEYRVLAISVAATHAHFLAELPTGYREMKQVVGECKSKSSHAIRDVVPEQVWMPGGDFNRVKNRQYQKNVYLYILRQKDVWIWDYAKEQPKEEEKEHSEEAQG